MTYNRKAVVDEENKKFLQDVVLIGCVILGVGPSLMTASIAPLLVMLPITYFIVAPIIK